jgi:phage terminase large subunit GpA-like protein
MAVRKSNNTAALFKEIAQVVAPPPDLTISEWADFNRRLSAESSAEPGQWRTDRVPYLREIMEAISDPLIETVVIMSSSQVGKTEVLLNTVGYHVDDDPAPIMYILPTVDFAKAFSKDRLAPMIRDTPALTGKVKEVRSRNSENTLLHKKFPGGHITLVGANAPTGLASRPIRILLADEVDRFPISAGTEGDPLTLQFELSRMSSGSSGRKPKLGISVFMLHIIVQSGCYAYIGLSDNNCRSYYPKADPQRTGVMYRL